MAKSSYLLGNNNSAAERLNIQHRLYEQASQRLLVDAGLKADMQLLEIGCGTGAMTQWLAAQLNSQGNLTAIDISPLHVELTKQNTANYSNVHVMLHDVHNMNVLKKKFDLIYCRMVLHHLTNPVDVIKMLANSLSSEGVLVFEEPPTIEHIFAYPKSPALDKMLDLIVQCFQINKIQYQIAYTMSDLMQQLGLTVKIQRTFQPLLNATERKLHVIGLNEISSKLLQCNLISEDELKQLAVNLAEELTQAKAVSHLQMIQVVGIKA